MKKEFRPFSNASDAQIWQYLNCDKCKRNSCHARRAIDMGYVVGTISIRTAKYIGLNDENRLVNACSKITDKRPVKVKKMVNDESLKLF